MDEFVADLAATGRQTDRQADGHKDRHICSIPFDCSIPFKVRGMKSEKKEKPKAKGGKKKRLGS